MLGLGAGVVLSWLAVAWAAVPVPKCCPLGEVIEDRVCKHVGRTIAPLVYDFDLSPSDEEYRLIVRPLPCSQRMLHPDDYWILKDGSLHRGPAYQLTKDYCLEEVTSLNETYPLLCPASQASYYLNTIGYALSLPFALATLLVYVMLKDLNTLHGKIVIANMAAFIVGSLLLVLTGTRLIDPIDTYCSFAGYAIQFFFMATFFWLNVMCFDIYWAFSGLRNLTGSVKERERKKLILYSCYAWGVPLFILLLTVGMDYSPYVPNDSIFKPAVGIDKCFFQKDIATGIYFYMPMGFVLLMNIVLFSITAFRICSLRRETAVLKRGDSRKHDSTNDKESVTDLQTKFLDNKKTPIASSGLMIDATKEPYIVKNIRFSLYLKLFLVMGINWVMELVSYLAGGPSYIWYIPDFTNTLQGVFIFIIFVWKERVRRLVWAKITSCCGCKVVSNPSRGQWTTSTRNTNSITNSSGITSNSIKMAPMPLTETNGLDNGVSNGMSNGMSNGGINNDRNVDANNAPPQGLA